MSLPHYDIAVIGGGINGTGIARDAAGRGLKVFLCEQDDLARATSSASTKLIHGGLRYLEYYEFRLVREALMEREVLLRAAPHIIWPLRFVLPHHKGLRPKWLLRLGLFLYDHLGGRQILPGTTRLDLRSSPEGRPLDGQYSTGFAYSDCWVDDARLVVLNALDAQARGAAIHTRTRCESFRRQGDGWLLRLRTAEGESFEVTARALVNAAGPWVTEVMKRAEGVKRSADLRLVKGSHVVIRRKFEGSHSYIFQNGDGRIAFAIPYEGQFTLLGTTDLSYQGDPAKVAIDDNEIDYILDLVNQYFTEKVSRDDIVWTYSGVRPLYNDKSANLSAVTRDYVFDIDAAEGEAPLLSIFGGKITTYRKLAEHALEKLSPLLGGIAKPWTAKAPLPGGDIADADFDAFLREAARRLPWMPAGLLTRYGRLYGTRLYDLVGTARSEAALGRHFGAGLYEAELDFLMRREWARTAEDVLWRRTKLGLHLDKSQAEAVAAWMAQAAEAQRLSA
ncbi:glycerol-3-phosphate dehydrogenase [Telmatospirillum sp. J64-1]|uniref:glycerol-3-phosphate dehydrogenase n=1 Tax=Telmatospirillum sp. J64-1 TaxID=2502183 RepID=UPI00115C981D|nr:glycerol-3-phosphate dehydrogenase [Telmatospirillum sp. J64-1]